MALTTGPKVLYWHARSKSVEFWVNHLSVADITVAGDVTYASTTAATLGGGGSAAIDATVSELILCNSMPSAVELAKLDAYMLGRYGI